MLTGKKQVKPQPTSAAAPAGRRQSQRRAASMRAYDVEQLPTQPSVVFVGTLPDPTYELSERGIVPDEPGHATSSSSDLALAQRTPSSLIQQVSSASSLDAPQQMPFHLAQRQPSLLQMPPRRDASGPPPARQPSRVGLHNTSPPRAPSPELASPSRQRSLHPHDPVGARIFSHEPLRSPAPDAVSRSRAGAAAVSSVATLDPIEDDDMEVAAALPRQRSPRSAAVLLATAPAPSPAPSSGRKRAREVTLEVDEKHDVDVARTRPRMAAAAEPAPKDARQAGTGEARVHEEIVRLHQWTVTRLRDVLRVNRMKQTGTKDELVERVADASVYGVIPRCPVCRSGFLRFGIRPQPDSLSAPHEVTELYYCPGAYDERSHTKKDCPYETSSIAFVPLKWGPR